MKSIASDIKVIVVGNSNTGKTSFVHKWTKNVFSENYKATIVSEFGYKIFEFNSKVYRIQMWDLAGQDKSIAMTKIFCKDSNGVIIMCDVTDNESLENTVKWKHSIDESVNFFDGTPLPMMLIQNKIDLVKNDTLDPSKLKDFANNNGFIMSYQTSVKDGINISESMKDFLATIIIKTEEAKHMHSHIDRNSITIGLKDSEKKKSGCC
jgi:small GTP-binding protein